MTARSAAEQLRRLWNLVEKIVIAASLLALVMNMLGFRWEEAMPGSQLNRLQRMDSVLAERIRVGDDSTRARVLAVEQENRGLRDEVRAGNRLLCLTVSRRDAQLAGACTAYPTRDESRGSR